jgi:hypothetical protein
MTETSTVQTQGAVVAEGRAAGPTGWVGWIGFASVMLLITGALQIFYGLVAVVNDEWVVWGNRANLYLDLTAWGWVHMGIGLVVVLAGLGVLTGNILARTIAVIVAAISLMANFLSLPAYPFWSLVVMTIDVLVIWALMVHGREMKPVRAIQL